MICRNLHIAFFLFFNLTVCLSQQIDNDALIVRSMPWTDAQAKINLGQNPLMRMSPPSDSVWMHRLRYEVALIYGREELTDQSGNLWSLAMDVNLTDGATNIGSKTLTIEADANNYQYIDLLSVEDTIRSELLLQITNVVETGTIPNDIRLELRLRNNTIQSFNRLTIPDLTGTVSFARTISGSSPSTVTGRSRINLEWDLIEGSQFYELQYVYLDLFGGSGGFVDWNRAITIRTCSNNYSVDMTYPKGIMSFRVRGIGRGTDVFGNSYDYVKGEYSTAAVNGLLQINIADGSIQSNRTNPFESNAHWQMQQSFAEEGKSKKVIQYFDNTLRSRQTITYLNDEKAALVAETDYDLEGRPTIQILPTPVQGNENNLFFKPEFNVNSSLQPFNYINHEKAVADALSDQAGAGRYYSDSMDQVVLHRDFLPDANGRPFTQMKYMRDQTGRVRKQSGVGDQYKLDEKDTRYYYLTPTQTELSRLFGDTIGLAHHYKKNVVIDPNGQGSVSYLDKSGQVVATALIGQTPNNVEEIDGADTVTLTHQLPIDRTANPDDERVLSHPFFNALPNETITFSYTVTPASVLVDDTCYFSAWDLSVYILDEDGNNINITIDGQSYSTFERRIEGIKKHSSNCGAVDSVYSFGATIAEIGEYTIYKKIIPLRNYWIREFSLITDSLINDSLIFVDVLSQIDTTSCYLTCELLCEEKYDPLSDSFSICLEGCEALADSFALDVLSLKCDAIEVMLANQLAPDVDEGTNIDTFLSSSIEDCLTNNNILLPIQSANGVLFYWDESLGSLLDEDSISLSNSEIIIAGSNGEIDTFDLSTELETILTSANPNYWQFEWGNALAICHAGYCHLELCEATWPSDSFDYMVSTIPDIDKAFEIFQLGSPSGNISTDLNSLLVAIRAADPLIHDPSVDAAYDCDLVVEFESTLDSYVCSLSDDLAEVAGICEAIDNSNDCNDCSFIEFILYTVAQEDSLSAWTLMATMYTGLKSKVIYKCSYIQCPPELAPGIAHDAEFLLAKNGDDLLNLADSILANGSSDCESQVEYWIAIMRDSFLSGSINAADSLVLRTNLIEHCQKQCGVLDLGSCWDNVPTIQTAGGECPSIPAILFPVLDPAPFNGIATISVWNVGLDSGGPTPPSSSCAFNHHTYDAWIGMRPTTEMLRIGILQNGCDEEIIRDLAVAVYSSSTCSNSSTFQVDSCILEKNYRGDIYFEIPASSDYRYFHVFTNSTFTGLVPEITFTRQNALYTNTPNILYSSHRPLNRIYNQFESQLTKSELLDYLDIPWSCRYRCGNVDAVFSEVIDSVFHGSSFSTSVSNDTVISKLIGGDGFDSLFIMTDLGNSPDIDQLSYVDVRMSSGSYEFQLISEDGLPLLLHKSITELQSYELVGKHYNDNYKELLVPIIAGHSEYLPLDLHLLYEKNGAEYFVNVWPSIIQKTPSSIEFNFSECRTPFSPEAYRDTCLKKRIEQAWTYTNQIVRDSQLRIENEWNETLRQSGVDEAASLRINSREYQYTLYYRDLLGNVLATVAPEGVQSNGSGNHDELHTTRYQFNGFNMPLSEKSTDAGLTKYFYDSDLRLRLTEDAKRRADGTFVYTRYDDAERIIETGELSNYATVSLNELDDPSFPDDALPPYQLDEEVITTYDIPDPSSAGFIQNQLHGRVSSVNRVQQAETYYNYDVHGNVESIRQQLNITSGVLSYDVFYDFDLISGNVHEVSFNPGSSDQYFHRYTYDADNRLLCVYSSPDQLTWEEDARYFYYQHGPLARIELGDDKVQGLDYYYTLQGWIKGMNMANGSGNRDHDPGKDGHNTVGNIDSLIAEDAFAYHLGYNKNDYNPISRPLPGNAMSTAWTNLYSPSDDGIYNGNIALSIYDNPANPDGQGRLHGHSYRYDQLHRILQDNSKFFLGNNWISSGVNSYSSSYSYDKNGNLLSLDRYRPLGGIGQQFDDLSYEYEPGFPNRLRRVDDGITNNGLRTDDIDDQSGTNYNYDEIGQLTNDASESQTITWDIYGKVRTLDNGIQTVVYRYDGMGNRVYKKVTPIVGDETLTLYIRDAQGNILSIHESATGVPMTQKEAILYGSSRLGTHARNIVTNLNAPTSDFIYQKDNKGYELSNHLGNVHSVVSDLKFFNGVRYSPLQNSYSSYYAFGYQNADRSLLSDVDNSFGFNGKLRDKSFGITSNYDYGFRIYNSGLARFLSVDPLKNSYAGWSPYPFAMNSPIAAIDLDGKEILVVGDDAHQAQVADLMAGLSMTPHGKKELASAMGGGRILLVKDGDVHKDLIRNSRNGFVAGGSTGNDGTEYDVLFISDNIGRDATNGGFFDEELSIPESPVAAFGHEVQHFIDGARKFSVAYGFFEDEDYGPLYRSDLTFGDGEINAVHTENILRTELGVPGLVTHYAGLEIINQEVDLNKKSRIIFNETSGKFELSPTKIIGLRSSEENYDYSQHSNATLSPGMNAIRKSKVTNTSQYLSRKTNEEATGILYELDNGNETPK